MSLQRDGTMSIFGKIYIILKILVSLILAMFFQLFPHNFSDYNVINIISAFPFLSPSPPIHPSLLSFKLMAVCVHVCVCLHVACLLMYKCFCIFVCIYRDVSYLYVFMDVYAYVTCMHSCECMCTHMCIWKLEVNVKYFLNHTPHYSWQQSLSGHETRW